MESPTLQKQALRERVNADLEALPTAERDTEGRILVGRIETWATHRDFEVLLATLPLASEPDLTPALAHWLAAGRRVALARTGPGRTLSFRYVADLRGPWEPRPFGLQEPPLSCAPWQPGPRTLVLVPGLAFAPAPGGGALRLGRGAGYYDRWLEVHKDQVFSLGVALSVQVVDEIPLEAHDQTLDGWVDPAGFHGF